MAIHAILWRGFVEVNRLALHFLLQSVAHGATHICVRAGQGELRALVVVKRGGRPPQIHVALGALRDPVLVGKLSAVRVGVAGFAIFRRPCKLNLVRAGKNFVALGASDIAMRTYQCEFRFRVVEAADVDP